MKRDIRFAKTSALHERSSADIIFSYEPNNKFNNLNNEARRIHSNTVSNHFSNLLPEIGEII